MKKDRKSLPDELQVRLLESARPLNRREYQAFRLNIGCLSAAEHMLDALENRLKECITDGWREARMLESRMRTLFDKLLRTIPREKLLLLKAELPRYQLYIRMDGAAKYDLDSDDFIVLPRKTAMTLVDYATEMHCDLCDREGKKIGKCKLHRVLSEALPFTAEGKDGSCPFTTYGVSGGKGLWVEDAE